MPVTESTIVEGIREMTERTTRHLRFAMHYMGKLTDLLERLEDLREEKLREPELEKADSAGTELGGLGQYDERK